MQQNMDSEMETGGLVRICSHRGWRMYILLVSREVAQWKRKWRLQVGAPGPESMKENV